MVTVGPGASSAGSRRAHRCRGRGGCCARPAILPWGRLFRQTLLQLLLRRARQISRLASTTRARARTGTCISGSLHIVPPFPHPPPPIFLLPHCHLPNGFVTYTHAHILEMDRHTHTHARTHPHTHTHTCMRGSLRTQLPVAVLTTSG